jgi:NADH-quinone oxidoreductase subunit M
MSTLPVLAIIVLAPVAGALLIMLFGRGQNAPKFIALVAGAVSLATSLWVFAAYDRAVAGYQFVTSVPWIPSLGITFTLGVDGISAPMLVLTSLIVFTGVLVSWNVTERPREYFALLLLLVTGVFGVFAAVDAFLLFFSYEMAVLPMYLLIAE